ncbi:MAG: ATP-dependent ligase, partial [Microbacterium sp.]|nr:ATP-dependent ligase [Microbacterium sp.]
WEALSQRIHPAASRVTMLSEETPAMFIAFDLLARGDRDLQTEPFAERRAQLEDLLGDVPHPVHVTRTTADPDLARRWLAEFEGAGLDGVVAKPLAQPYAPNKRTMFKIKHARTADVVALGYRIHKSGQGVGSLLVGLYDDEGRLHGVGGVSAWTDKRRLELIDELAPLVERDADGEAVVGETDRSRFSASKDVSFVRLRPERVLEVRYDQLEGMRFRHTEHRSAGSPPRVTSASRGRHRRNARSSGLRRYRAPATTGSLAYTGTSTLVSPPESHDTFGSWPSAPVRAVQPFSASASGPAR